MKRFIDMFLSITLLVLLLPVILVIAVVIAISMGRPVLFKQQRPGLNGQPFYLYKFRTMVSVQTDEDMGDEVRLTRVGRLLRKCSLDELPQLVNVVKGNMSLVGPRPLLMEYLPLYTEEQALRHTVKPGMTGWAQVNGRNAITWEEKFKLDTWYVHKQTILLDCSILIRTIIKVFKKEGINQQETASMLKFTGTKEVV